MHCKSEITFDLNFKVKMVCALKMKLVLLFRGCLYVKFHPGMKLFLEWNHLCLWWSVSYSWHIFVRMKFHVKKAEMIFHPGMKKIKNICQYFILGWIIILQFVIFISFFDEVSNFCNRILKSDSHLPEKLFYLLQWKPFKND